MSVPAHRHRLVVTDPKSKPFWQLVTQPTHHTGQGESTHSRSWVTSAQSHLRTGYQLANHQSHAAPLDHKGLRSSKSSTQDNSRIASQTLPHTGLLRHSATWTLHAFRTAHSGCGPTHHHWRHSGTTPSTRTTAHPFWVRAGTRAHGSQPNGAARDRKAQSPHPVTSAPSPRASSKERTNSLTHNHLCGGAHSRHSGAYLHRGKERRVQDHRSEDAPP
jgi:hypothetical protein